MSVCKIGVAVKITIFYVYMHTNKQNEPLNVYLKMGDCMELEEWATQNIAECTSFKAVNSEGEMIGIVLNAFMHKPVI